MPLFNYKYLLPFLFFAFINCVPAPQEELSPYKTKNVIIIVVDGPRYTETWGDSAHKYIPHLAKEMAKEGVVFSNFYNNGPTYTNSGHTTLTTGYSQEINNKGTEFPKYPSIFQYYLKKTGKDKSKAWVITTKDKLEILANTTDSAWKDTYRPSTDCGTRGLGSDYREDSVTFKNVVKVLKTEHPNLVLVNFKEPDASGHANNWAGYLKGIKDTDAYVWELWKLIKTDPFYKDNTTLFVTNDHGRHLDNVKDGFINHGCPCEGCQHINLYAYGPDFKKNVVVKDTYYQKDVPATIAKLLDLQMPHSEGKPIDVLFKAQK